MDLRSAIERYGYVEGSLLKVERFLNHRVEPSVMASVGREIAKRLVDDAVDLIVTAEASGIPPALATSFELNVPTVYAKKFVGAGNPANLSRTVSSPTKGTEYRVEVAANVIEPGARVAIVDDFLARGRTAEALGQIVTEATADLAGFVFAIEKASMGGRELLESHGWSVRALVTIGDLSDETISFL